MSYRQKQKRRASLGKVLAAHVITTHVKAIVITLLHYNGAACVTLNRIQYLSSIPEQQ